MSQIRFVGDSSYNARVSESDWQRMKSAIEDMHRQKRKRKDIQARAREEFGVTVTANQLSRKMNQWGFRVYREQTSNLPQVEGLLADHVSEVAQPVEREVIVAGPVEEEGAGSAVVSERSSSDSSVNPTDDTHPFIDALRVSLSPAFCHSCFPWMNEMKIRFQTVELLEVSRSITLAGILVCFGHRHKAAEILFSLYRGLLKDANIRQRSSYEEIVLLVHVLVAHIECLTGHEQMSKALATWTEILQMIEDLMQSENIHQQIDAVGHLKDFVHTYTKGPGYHIVALSPYTTLRWTGMTLGTVRLAVGKLCDFRDLQKGWMLEDQLLEHIRDCNGVRECLNMLTHKSAIWLQLKLRDLSEIWVAHGLHMSELCLTPDPYFIFSFLLGAIQSCDIDSVASFHSGDNDLVCKRCDLVQPSNFLVSALQTTSMQLWALISCYRCAHSAPMILEHMQTPLSIFVDLTPVDIRALKWPPPYNTAVETYVSGLHKSFDKPPIRPNWSAYAQAFEIGAGIHAEDLLTDRINFAAWRTQAGHSADACPTRTESSEATERKGIVKIDPETEYLVKAVGDNSSVSSDFRHFREMTAVTVKLEPGLPAWPDPSVRFTPLSMRTVESH